MPGYLTLISISYPLLVHLSIYTGHVAWAAKILGVMLILPLLGALLRHKRPNAWAGFLALCAIAIWLFGDQYAESIVQLHPVMMFGAMFALFASTLQSGTTPLISRFAILIRGDVPEAVITYGRWATLAWALFFLLMIAVSITLSFAASLETWSWFMNVGGYLFVLLMFVVEFAVRRQVLKEHVDYSFVQFMRDLANVDYRRLMREWRP